MAPVMNLSAFLDNNQSNNKNTSKKAPHRRPSSSSKRSIFNLSLTDSPDSCPPVNSDDDELEYDHWPGQIDLVSSMTTSSSTLATNKDDEIEDGRSVSSSSSSSLDDLNLDAMQPITTSMTSSVFTSAGGFPSSGGGLLGQECNDNFEYPLVQMLQEQVGVLVESQATTDDKYTKVKQDNSSLTTRIHMLEEHIRDLEVKSEERIEDEQKRNKELIVRMEREKALEIENFTIRLQTLERENSNLTEENSSLRSHVDHLKSMGQRKEELLQEIQTNHTVLQKEHSELESIYRKEQSDFTEKNLENSRIIEDLYKETEELKSSLLERHTEGIIGSSDSEDDVFGNLASRISEMESEIRSLREKNGSLMETNEELQAQMLNRGLEEGKILLNGPSDDSLAAEFEAMNENEIRSALKDQQEVNTSLRRYIDGILMNIMEKYPELLEVRK